MYPFADREIEKLNLAGESLLTAMERAGLSAPSRCRSGECGVCHSYLANGNVYVPSQVDGRRAADLTYGLYPSLLLLPCQRYHLRDSSAVNLEVSAF